MKKRLMFILAILFIASSVFAMKVYLTNSAGSGQAQANPNASLGGYRSTTELSAVSMKNLFDNVSIWEALLGDVEYRMIDIYNDGATDALRVQFYMRTPTSSPKTELNFGYSATAQPHADAWNGEALANESTAPASPAMTFANYTKTAPVALGTIAAGKSARICVKRTVTAGAGGWTAQDLGSFGVRWGTEAAVYSDILFYWGCESTTAEHHDGTDGSATASSLVEITACPVGFGAGTNCLHGPASNDYYTFDLDGNVDLTSGRMGGYVYIDTWAQYAAIFELRYDAGDRIVCYLSGTDELMLKYYGQDNDDCKCVTTNANLAVDTEYFIEIAWGGATDHVAIYVDGVKKISNTTNAVPEFTGGQTPNSMNFGVYGGYEAKIYMDQIMSSSDPTRDLNALKDTILY